MTEMNKDRRYEQLMHLLEKSSIYTSFILDKIKDEEEAKAKQEEKAKKNAEKETKSSTRGRRSSKRKKTNLSDVIDKQVLHFRRFSCNGGVSTSKHAFITQLSRHAMCSTNANNRGTRAE